MSDVMPDVQIELEVSEQHAEIFAALAKAQASMTGAKKDAQNPHLKNWYADLANVIDAVRPALSANGIAFIQAPASSREGVSVVTQFGHSSGQWIRSRLRMPVAKVDAQGIGSAITYARRYALMAMAGIAPDDDDAETAVQPAPPQRPQSVPSPRAPSQAQSGTRASFSEAETAKAFAHRLQEAGDHGDVAGIGIVWKQVEEAKLPEKLHKRLDEVRAAAMENVKLAAGAR